MRIALFQGPEQSADVAHNLERLATVAHAAAERKARLLILPEMFLTGYNIGKDTTHRLAEPVDGPTAQRAAAIARKTGLALLYGYPERAGDAVYNAAQLIDRDAGGSPIIVNRICSVTSIAVLLLPARGSRHWPSSTVCASEF